MPKLSQPTVTAPRVEFVVSVPLDLMNAMYFTSLVEQNEGIDGWPAEVRKEADPELLAELIARNVAIKAAVVAADERESGERAHLNFGHTIGHAVEAAAGFGIVAHGQAVAIGMVAACHIAVARGLIEPSDAERVRELLSELSLPVRFADLPDLPDSARDPAKLAEIMAHDKKACAGVVRFVLPTNLGNVAVFDDVTPDLVAEAIGALGG